MGLTRAQVSLAGLCLRFWARPCSSLRAKLKEQKPSQTAPESNVSKLGQNEAVRDPCTGDVPILPGTDHAAASQDGNRQLWSFRMGFNLLQKLWVNSRSLGTLLCSPGPAVLAALLPLASSGLQPQHQGKSSLTG